MAKVTDMLATDAGNPTVICDFTPPRGADRQLLEGARALRSADCVSVAYNPGKLVRVDSVAAASALREVTGRDVIFNLSPRDMNRLALESRLLGAQLLGLENVLVIQGDAFTARDGLGAAGDYNATGLIAAIRNLNAGNDHRGAALRSPLDLCIGASIDLNRKLEAEAKLTLRKIEAGAQFFVTQPIFDPAEAAAFLSEYRRIAGAHLEQPIFWGLQVLRADGVIFSNVPKALTDQLAAGRDGAEIAIETCERFRSADIANIYLVSPILKGGARDYEAAGRVLAQIRAAPHA